MLDNRQSRFLCLSMLLGGTMTAFVKRLTSILVRLPKSISISYLLPVAYFFAKALSLSC